MDELAAANEANEANTHGGSEMALIFLDLVLRAARIFCSGYNWF